MSTATDLRGQKSAIRSEGRIVSTDSSTKCSTNLAASSFFRTPRLASPTAKGLFQDFLTVFHMAESGAPLKNFPRAATENLIDSSARLNAEVARRINDDDCLKGLFSLQELQPAARLAWMGLFAEKFRPYLLREEFFRDVQRAYFEVMAENNDLIVGTNSVPHSQLRPEDFTTIIEGGPLTPAQTVQVLKARAAFLSLSPSGVDSTRNHVFADQYEIHDSIDMVLERSFEKIGKLQGKEADSALKGILAAVHGGFSVEVHKRLLACEKGEQWSNAHDQVLSELFKTYIKDKKPREAIALIASSAVELSEHLLSDMPSLIAQSRRDPKVLTRLQSLLDRHYYLGIGDRFAGFRPINQNPLQIRDFYSPLSDGELLLTKVQAQLHFARGRRSEAYKTLEALPEPLFPLGMVWLGDAARLEQSLDSSIRNLSRAACGGAVQYATLGLLSTPHFQPSEHSFALLRKGFVLTDEVSPRLGDLSKNLFTITLLEANAAFEVKEKRVARGSSDADQEVAAATDRLFQNSSEVPLWKSLSEIVYGSTVLADVVKLNVYRQLFNSVMDLPPQLRNYNDLKTAFKGLSEMK